MELHGNSKITPEAREKIIGGIKSGLPYDNAAHLARIHHKTLYNWLVKGREDLEAGIESEYVNFLHDIKEVEAQRIANHIASIAGQTERWQASAWMLERHPVSRKVFGQNAEQFDELSKEIALIRQSIEGKDKGVVENV